MAPALRQDLNRGHPQEQHSAVRDGPEDREYLIKAELPEVGDEDVKVTAEKGPLTISGERKFEKPKTIEVKVA
jgi:HSP20 family molecular chaperone IbpA